MNESDTARVPTGSANSTDDSELLRRYAAENRQDAFAELVRRHMSLVYHAALRQLGDADQAEEVAQLVFTDLARKASALRHRSVLAGWLHTSTRYAASNLRRRRTRQQQRDHSSYLMQQDTSSEPSDWGRLRPVIDEALYSLGERDREAVLLRFFEGCSFGQIAAKLSVTEDAARVRVNRALEKLAATLQQRGMTSTAAALAVALGTETAAAVPAGLATHITASALAASSLGAAGLFSGLFMKVALGASATVAVAAMGFAVRETAALHRVQDQLAVAERERGELRSELAVARSQLAEAKKQAAEESADTATLLSAIARARSGSKGAGEAVASGEVITSELVDSRFQNAKRLVGDGRWEEGLKEYLWCFDEGMVRIARYYGVRLSFLTSALGELAQKYPPARAAIEARIAAAEQKIHASSANHEAAAEFAALNRALGDDARTLAVFDQMPLEDPRRQGLAGPLYETFLSKQRYADAVGARSYDHSLRMLTMMEQQLSGRTVADDASPALRRAAVTHAANSVEALAGAGDLQHARDLAAKVLTLDNSRETVALLQARLTRAGHPEVLAALNAGSRQ